MDKVTAGGAIVFVVDVERSEKTESPLSRSSPSGRILLSVGQVTHRQSTLLELLELGRWMRSNLQAWSK